MLKINSSYQIENLEYTIKNITSIFFRDKKLLLPMFEVIIEARSYNNEFKKQIYFSLTYTYPHFDYPKMYCYDIEVANMSFLKLIFSSSKSYSDTFKKRYENILKKQFNQIIKNFYEKYTREYLTRNNYDDTNKTIWQIANDSRGNEDFYKFLAVKFSKEFKVSFKNYAKDELDRRLENFDL